MNTVPLFFADARLFLTMCAHYNRVLITNLMGVISRLRSPQTFLDLILVYLVIYFSDTLVHMCGKQRICRFTTGKPSNK